jgi:2-dehydro-3-deoxygalactonokinase
MTGSIRPALVGLDWGTSSLRAYLFDTAGAVAERRARPWGIQALPAGGFPAAFQGTVGDWLDRAPGLPVIACGMVGSRQGWREAAYVACPLDLRDLAGGLLHAETECGRLAIVPGVIQPGDVPDVMRGEETQLMGAVAADPATAEDCLGVLPGTHSKWVTLRAGRITEFTTFITGELFATLRDHSLLGRPAREAGLESSAAARAEAFARGVRAACDAGSRGVAGLLFTARTLWLTGSLPAAETLDYLSGLLVGDEVRGMIAGRDGGGPPLVLVGAAELCDRYRAALAACGRADVRLAGDTAAAGLWRIAVEARLTT